MTRSAGEFTLDSDALDALLVTAHPQRSAPVTLSIDGEDSQIIPDEN